MKKNRTVPYEDLEVEARKFVNEALEGGGRSAGYLGSLRIALPLVGPRVLLDAILRIWDMASLSDKIEVIGEAAIPDGADTLLESGAVLGGRVARSPGAPPRFPDGDGGLDTWSEAISRPAVRDRLAYWAKWIGDIPAESFLVAVLDNFDEMHSDNKKGAILRALNVSGARDAADDDFSLGDNGCRRHLEQLAASRAEGVAHV